MPLRNRLEEVIRRYEKASTLVKKYKEGEVSEEELGHGFHGLRQERRLVDENNRMYLREQRRVHLGEKVAKQYEEEDVSEDDEEEEEDQEESDLDEDEDEDADEGGNTDQVDVTEAPMAPTDKREAKLWKQYGEFWDSA